ncbi:MAG: hypothetical protein H7124_12850 [Phycisphaerales bacterium]|nr:hypothetical protein [Hyphomonadaceae bacterium]
MTHTAPSATADVENRASSAGLPAIGACILAAIWGGYTLLVVVEIFMTPVPS